MAGRCRRAEVWPSGTAPPSTYKGLGSSPCTLKSTERERASGDLGEGSRQGGESLPGGLRGGSDDITLALLRCIGNWKATIGLGPGEGLALGHVSGRSF